MLLLNYAMLDMFEFFQPVIVICFCSVFTLISVRNLTQKFSKEDL